MVIVENKTNTITIEIEASVDISGFSLTLAACGVVKRASDLSSGKVSFVFSPEESIMRWNGVYGELKVIDSENELYLKLAPLIIVVPENREYEAIGQQGFMLSIASNFENIAQGGGEGGGVTPEDLARAIKGANKYTDEQVEAAGTIAVETVQMEVQTETGPELVTVHQTAQSVQNVMQEINQIKEKGVAGYIKDKDGDGQPDDGVLYMDLLKNSN